MEGQVRVQASAASVILPAASSAAYPGRGCRGTGYVEACRRFGDRTKGPFAAVH
jgi:hypothetical protein